MFLENGLKKLIYMFCVVLLWAVFMTGCGNGKNANGSKTAEDGRSYGGTIEGIQGETLSTAFFDMTVEDCTAYETFQFDEGLYQAEEGNTYLVVTVTIKNTYEADIPVGITDFTLDYEGAGEQAVMGFGKADLKLDGYMENVFTLKRGESLTGKILYTVPDKKEYILGYSEYYEDQFRGDQFFVKMAPKK